MRLTMIGELEQAERSVGEISREIARWNTLAMLMFPMDPTLILRASILRIRGEHREVIALLREHAARNPAAGRTAAKRR